MGHSGFRNGVESVSSKGTVGTLSTTVFELQATFALQLWNNQECLLSSVLEHL